MVWPALTVAGAAVKVGAMPAAPITKLPDEAVAEATAAPELASVPLALAEKTTVPGVVPATKVHVKVALAPAASEATDAGTGPPVPGLSVARLAGVTVGKLGTTLLSAAPPELVTVIATVNAWPTAAAPEAGRLAVSAAGFSTVTCAGRAGSVAPVTVVPEKLSVALAAPAKANVPAPVAA